MTQLICNTNLSLTSNSLWKRHAPEQNVMEYNRLNSHYVILHKMCESCFICRIVAIAYGALAAKHWDKGYEDTFGDLSVIVSVQHSVQANIEENISSTILPFVRKLSVDLWIPLKRSLMRKTFVSVSTWKDIQRIPLFYDLTPNNSK